MCRSRMKNVCTPGSKNGMRIPCKQSCCSLRMRSKHHMHEIHLPSRPQTNQGRWCKPCQIFAINPSNTQPPRVHPSMSPKSSRGQACCWVTATLPARQLVQWLDLPVVQAWREAHVNCCLLLLSTLTHTRLCLMQLLTADTHTHPCVRQQRGGMRQDTDRCNLEVLVTHRSRPRCARGNAECCFLMHRGCVSRHAYVPVHEP